MATMDPDAVIMPPDRPSIVGKEEIRRLSNDYSAVFQEKCSVVYDEVETVGDWGFVRATVTGTRTYKSGGGVENVSLKNLWIVKRQADGQWKFWRIMFNNTPLCVLLWRQAGRACCIADEPRLGRAAPVEAGRCPEYSRSNSDRFVDRDRG